MGAQRSNPAGRRTSAAPAGTVLLAHVDRQRLQRMPVPSPNAAHADRQRVSRRRPLPRLPGAPPRHDLGACAPLPRRLRSRSALQISAAPRRDAATAALCSRSHALSSCALVTFLVVDCRATARAVICPDGTAIARCPAMQNLRFLACVVAALGSMAIAGCGDDNDCDNNNHNNNCGVTVKALRVQNQSGFAIKAIQVTSVGGTTWSTNLLSGTLASGQSLTVAVSCGSPDALPSYDVLLVDEAGESCTLHDVDLCSSTADWTITSVIIGTSCSAFTHKTPAPDPASGAAH
jgi:hypothetical protein